MMDAAVSSKVRLRIQKAQETRKDQKTRLSQAKKNLVLANEALDAATTMYEVEVQHLQKLDVTIKQTLTVAQGASAVGILSDAVADKVRRKSCGISIKLHLTNMWVIFWCNTGETRGRGCACSVGERNSNSG